MQTLTVEITNRGALKVLHSLKEKKFIRIVDETKIDSPALPGTPLSLSEFKNWISDAESNNSMSLKKAKQKWQGKRKRLQKLIK